MRYNVTLSSFAELSAIVEVEAESEEEANELALEKDDIDWDIVEHEQHRTVNAVEEAE